jgi:hypothetical protein
MPVRRPRMEDRPSATEKVSGSAFRTPDHRDNLAREDQDETERGERDNHPGATRARQHADLAEIQPALDGSEHGQALRQQKEPTVAP